MKKTFLGLLACALFISAAYCAEDKIDANTWSFGRVREGQIVKHTFSLQNESDKTLTIKDVHTSCGCTASEIKKKVLRPGESTEVGVSFNSKGYSGEVKQFIYLNTDDIDTSASLGINGESFDYAQDGSPKDGELVEPRSRTIDNPVIRFIIKAEVVKSSQGEPLP